MTTNKQLISWTKKYGRFGLFSLIALSIIFILSSIREQSNETNNIILAIIGCSTLIYLFFYSATIKHIIENKQLSEEEFHFILNPFVKISGYLSFITSALIIIIAIYDFYQAFIWLNKSNGAGFLLMAVLGIFLFAIGFCISKYVYHTMKILRLNIETNLP